MRIEELVKAGKKVPAIGMGCTIHYYSDAEPAPLVLYRMICTRL